MEQFTNPCQVVIQQLNEFINLLVNIIRNLTNQITALFSWSKPTQIEIIFLDQSASAHGRILSQRKSSKKRHRPSNSMSIGLSSDIDLNIPEHIEEVEQPQQQMQILTPPPVEIGQDELKDDTTVMDKVAITDGSKNIVQKEMEKELLTANEQDDKVSLMKPELLNTAIMQHQEQPIPIIQQDANQLEIKPLSLPNPQMLPEKNKKPLPGLNKKRIVKPCKISNKQNAAKDQHAINAKPRWR